MRLLRCARSDTGCRIATHPLGARNDRYFRPLVSVALSLGLLKEPALSGACPESYRRIEGSLPKEPALSLSKGLNRLLNCDTVTGSVSLNGFRLSRADAGDGFLGESNPTAA